MRRAAIIVGTLILVGLIFGNVIGQYVQSVKPLFEVAK